MFNNLKIGKATQTKEIERLGESADNLLGTMTEKFASSADYSADEVEPDHFDDLLGESLGGSDGGQPPTDGHMLDHGAFHALFCVSFNTASTVTKLQSLSVDKEDEACQNCTRALYETILDIPMLHFVLKPSGKWMERMIAIGMFTVPMAIGVSQELAARRNSSHSHHSPEKDLEHPMGGSLKEMAEAQGI